MAGFARPTEHREAKQNRTLAYFIQGPCINNKPTLNMIVQEIVFRNKTVADSN